ncbi:hypothetical protein M7I_6304 [Glarea lozoyensis 74030]|uniref:Uncharacterized protein n=1 Tax=Glarea lozoyensis (strain ATCC 74030 / MF5533) TaxID=1104152 RepID=H0EU73_GLAL7|nr:hypothetical protein M7I_6304 [Glarea lozoyensis 74030]
MKNMVATLPEDQDQENKPRIHPNSVAWNAEDKGIYGRSALPAMVLDMR